MSPFPADLRLPAGAWLPDQARQPTERRAWDLSGHVQHYAGAAHQQPFRWMTEGFPAGETARSLEDWQNSLWVLSRVAWEAAQVAGGWSRVMADTENVLFTERLRVIECDHAEWLKANRKKAV